jgi:hypothetical protein
MISKEFEERRKETGMNWTELSGSLSNRFVPSINQHQESHKVCFESCIGYCLCVFYCFNRNALRKRLSVARPLRTSDLTTVVYTALKVACHNTEEERHYMCRAKFCWNKTPLLLFPGDFLFERKTSADQVLGRFLFTKSECFWRWYVVINMIIIFWTLYIVSIF